MRNFFQLNAFREVEDALTREQQQKERIGLLENQSALPRNTVKSLEIKYVGRFFVRQCLNELKG